MGVSPGESAVWPLLEFQWKALLRGPGWRGISQHTGAGSFQEGQKTFNGEGADDAGRGHELVGEGEGKSRGEGQG